MFLFYVVCVYMLFRCQIPLKRSLQEDDAKAEEAKKASDSKEEEDDDDAED